MRTKAEERAERFVRQQRLDAVMAALQGAARPRGDFSWCSHADEARFAGLGGTSSEWELLNADDENTARVALECLTQQPRQIGLAVERVKSSGSVYG